MRTGARRCRSPCDAGSAPIELVLGAGLLLFPVALLVLTFPTWVERQNVARAAAQEAARAVAVADSLPAGLAAAHGIAAEIAANHGIAPQDLRVSISGTLARAGTLTAVVTVRFPAAVVPSIGPVGGFAWRVSHSERVEDYRSLPHDAAADAPSGAGASVQQ